MRVLVTGGAGYIGSVTAQALLDAGHSVVIIDNLSTGHQSLLPPDATFIEGSVGDDAIVRAAISNGTDGVKGVPGVDACIHFAASIEAGESMRHPERFFANNTAQTLQLLQSLTEAGVQRFVFSSTAAVYGDPEQVPLREDARLQPTNAYGETKLLVERALPWFASQRGLRYAALRYFNASGATASRGETHDPESHLIPLVLRVALGLADEALIFGDDYPTPDGTCIRDYIHVADLADAHLRAVTALETSPTIVCNLGNGRGFSVLEVIDACRRASGHPIPARVVPRRAGDPAQLIASSDRARSLLGWTPAYPHLDDIVTSAWRWHTRTI